MTVSFEDLVRKVVREELAKVGPTPLRVRAGQMGLGSRRTETRLCREGVLEGAVKIGRSWWAPRSSVEAYVATHAQRAPSTTSTTDDELVAMMRAAGSRRGYR